MNKANWTLKYSGQSTDCLSFPFAFRMAYDMVRKAIEAKQSPASVAKEMVILGPVNGRGERTKYTYSEAMDLAQDQGLLVGGNINSKEFKKKF